MLRIEHAPWFAGALLLFAVTGSAQFFDLPPLPPPAQYGNLLIERQAETSAWPPVSFSHWSHRMRHTCRVCHFELGFAMQVNATEITEQANRAGQYCGACHDGGIAFGHTEEYCVYCHNFGNDGSEERFATLPGMPAAPFGNRIDWGKALEQGLIQPQQSLFEDDFEPVAFERGLGIEAGWTLIPAVEFPHDRHIPWLDCGDCHPGLFNIKKETTMHLEMRHILDGKFCGVCHMKVAFPLDDCKRCHPKMRK